MRVAVAVLLVLAACAIFVVQAEHCVAAGGDQANNQTGDHSSNQTSAVNDTSHTAGQNNQTQDDSEANATDDQDDYLYNDEYNVYYDNGTDNATGYQDDYLYNDEYDNNYDNTADNITDDQDDYSYDYNDEYNNYYDNTPGEDYGDSYYDNDNGEGGEGRGAITGVILSSAGSHAIPNANVALYDENDDLADIPDNPQLSSNGTGNNGGVYTFYDVPYGRYRLTAEKDGVEFFAMVDLTSGTATANVVLPEYVETEPAYREPQPSGLPTPTPRPLRYFIPITVGKMSAASGGGQGDGLPMGLAAVGGICALILFTRRNGNGKA